MIISGGGAKGAFAAGAIRQIFTEYRGTGWFSIVGGSSTGALITPFAGLMGAPQDIAREAVDQLIEQYSTISTPDILERKSILEFIKRQDCLNKSTPLRQRINEVFAPECFEWLKSKPAPYCYVVYTNYQSGERVIVSPKDPGMTRERFIDAMMASASVPVLMEATVIDGQVCYDGGVRDLLPFSRAIDLGAETIVPIFLDAREFSQSESRFHRVDKVLLRTLSIMLDETGTNDVEMANLVNIAIRAKKEILAALGKRPVCRRRIERILAREEYRDLFGRQKHLVKIVDGLRPDRALTDDALHFDPHTMRRWIELGEQKAREVVGESPFL